MSNEPYNLLHTYYTAIQPNPRVLELTGASKLHAPYTRDRDTDLTVIINAYARPEYLPLIWESFQYQSRRPGETWIIQNNPEGRSGRPENFLLEVKRRNDTRVIDSGLNHGCWFRFFVAALYCRTKFVVICDDDTMPGRLALETAVQELERQPGVYGGRGIILDSVPGGPSYWHHTLFGWPVATATTTRVDFVQQLWILETAWLPELLKHLPNRLFATEKPGRECGEELYVSYIADKLEIPSYVYGHGGPLNAKWSSIQGFEMGDHPNAMYVSGGLQHADAHLSEYVRYGWNLLNYGNQKPVKGSVP